MSYDRTRSEELFEKFCNSHSLEWERIDVGGDTTTPDYMVHFPHGDLAVEVKQVEPNDDDKACYRELEQRGVACMWGDTSNAIRNKIGKASRQLKARTNAESPGMVLLFDNGTIRGVDATAVRNAMYGDDCVSVRPFGDGRAETVPHLGGGRKCTADDNRTVSAVAIITEAGDGHPRISIYHNVHAACPLPVEWFDLEGSRQYTIDLSASHESFPEWRRIL